MMDNRPVSSDPIDTPGFWELSLAFPKYAIAVILAGTITFLIVLFIVAPEQMLTTRAGFPVFLSLLAAAAWLLLSRGKIRASVQLLAVGLWGYVTGVSFFFGGLHSMVIIVYPLIIMMVGWLLGARFATILSALTVVTGFGFFQAELWDFLPLRPRTPPALIWTVQTFVFVLSAVLITQLVKSYQKRLEELRKVGRDLVQRTAEVQAREADLNRAQSVAHTGSWVYDLASDVMHLSAETCRIFGLPEGLKGSHDAYLARVHPEDRSALSLAWQAALKGELFDNEHRIVVDKAIRWIRQKAELEIDADGTPLRCLGTTQDITERRQAGEALLESEARFRQMFERNDAAMLLIEPDSGAIVDANLAASSFYGYSVQCLQTMLIDQVNTLSPAEIAAERARASSHERNTFVFSHRLASGDIRGVEVHSSPIDVGGRVLLFSIIHDITEQQRAEAETLEAQIQLKATLEAIPDVLFELDLGGRYHDYHSTQNEFLAVPSETFLGNLVSDFLPSDATAIVMSALRETNEKGRSTGKQIALQLPQGKMWFELSVSRKRTESGQEPRFIVLSRDITERKRAESITEQYRTIIQASLDGFWITDSSGRILDANESMCRMLGYAREELLRLNISDIETDESPEESAAHIRETVKTGHVQFEARHRRKDGAIINVEISVLHVADLGERFFAFVRDITQSKAAAEEIQNLAFYDPLTRLPNRRLLLDRLQQALASSTRSGRGGALLFIDLDNFKSLNDTLGHDKGDLLLQQVAQRLATCIREGDSVARLGGDEFVVLLEDLSGDPQEAGTQSETVGEKILATLNQTFLLAGHPHHSTSSIGVSLFSGHRESMDELLRRADLAMYQAKAAGRHTLRFFDPDMQAVVTARAALEVDLHHGVQEDEFLLYYQPQVDGKGHMTGAEMLLRWQHPARGLIAPAEFIPLAEETGLILSLGHWVLETACTQLVNWAAEPDMAHLTLAVNVSARQFLHPDFVERVLAVLDHTGANPRKLKLELTESLLLDDVEDTIAKMTALKDRGVGFSLDDFGTGYSSLSYLKRLPLCQLKIDKSFVRDILNDPNDAAIARTIVALAQSLGLTVIAEGVETEGQRDFLASHGCHAYQGYLFSRPLPLDGFEEFVKRC